jgi:hypothetical protein
VIFILAPGADPSLELLNFANDYFANIRSDEERGLTTIPLSKG